MSQPSRIETSEFLLPATDGHALGCTLYQPLQDNAKALLVIAGATGVPQGFYRKFAEFAVAQQYSVLTLDYRGIGRSKPDTLRGFKMDYLDWAKKDLSAALSYAKSTHLPIYIIGHSYGGHAIGLLPDLDDIQGAWTFGTGAGWHGWMPKMEQWRVRLMWHFVGPILTRIYGYLAWNKLGMGEDLPLNVYKQWKHWCSFPNYFFDDPNMPEVQQAFSRAKFPIVAVNSVDDKWAPPASRDAFMRNYNNANLTLETIIPNDHNSQHIGHMGYFRSHCKSLWLSIFQGIDRQLS